MKTRDKSLVLGAFERPEDARRALRDLREADFKDKEVGILAKDDEGNTEFKSFKELEGNKAPEGAAAGAAAGAGGGALWALGIAAGILPAIGPVVAGGLLGAVVASAAAGAAAGTAAGALIGVGVSDEEAAYYEEELRRGRTVVVVKSPRRTDEALRILERHNVYHRPQDPAAARREASEHRMGY